MHWIHHRAHCGLRPSIRCTEHLQTVQVNDYAVWSGAQDRLALEVSAVKLTALATIIYLSEQGRIIIFQLTILFFYLL